MVAPAGAQALMNFRHDAGERGLVETLIEHLPLCAALDQVLKFLLAVYLDEVFGELLELLYWHQLTVHIGTRASVDADHAPHDHLVMMFDGLRLEPGDGRIGQGGKTRRDLRPLSPLAHDVDAAAPAGNEQQGVDHDGFSGAGFAGQRREARTEFQFRLVDNDQILELQMCEHAIGYSALP